MVSEYLQGSKNMASEYLHTHNEKLEKYPWEREREREKKSVTNILCYSMAINSHMRSNFPYNRNKM